MKWVYLSWDFSKESGVNLPDGGIERWMRDMACRRRQQTHKSA